MAQKSREQLKQIFQSGKIPSQQDFWDLFDSFWNLIDNGSVSTGSVITGPAGPTGPPGSELNVFGLRVDADFSTLVIPFLMNPGDVGETEINYFGKQILKLPSDLSMWSSVEILNLGGNNFQEFPDLTFISNLNTIYLYVSGDMLGNITTNFNGLKLPPSVTDIDASGMVYLDDYIKIYDSEVNQNYNLSNLDLSECAISEENVDAQFLNILQMQTYGNYVGTPGTIDLSGGTNAAPSSAGLSYILQLVNDYGWSIITN